MKLTFILCLGNVAFVAICGAIYALFGVNALAFLCFYNQLAVRVTLAISGASALFLLFSMLFLHPLRGLR